MGEVSRMYDIDMPFSPKRVIPCQAFQFGGSLCADRPRFVQFGNTLFISIGIKQIGDGTRTAP